jgi:chemotaxis protein MotB
MSKKHKGGGHDEIHADERWLITYADMITLLLAVFIVMYALSDTNLRKFNSFAQSMSSVFNTDVLSGTSQITVSEGQATTPDQGSKQAAMGYVGSEAATLQATIKNYAIAKGIASGVDVVVVPNGVAIRISGDLLFQPGRATLAPEAAGLLSVFIENLQLGPDQVIRVEGNTDSTPVSGPLFADNFELSAARALAVLHFLEEAGVDPSLLSLAGNGATKPLPSIAPADPANRRVEIYLIKPEQSYPAPTPVAPSIAPSFNPVFGG